MAGAVTILITDTGAEAVVQFTDPAGVAIEGPLDSVTGAEVLPVLVSSDTTKATIAAGVADATAPGKVTYAITPVAATDANGVSFTANSLQNSDGTPVLEPAGTPNAGQPFEVPGAAVLVIEGDAATGFTLSVQG